MFAVETRSLFQGHGIGEWTADCRVRRRGLQRDSQTWAIGQGATTIGPSSIVLLILVPGSAAYDPGVLSRRLRTTNCAGSPGRLELGGAELRTSVTDGSPARSGYIDVTSTEARRATRAKRLQDESVVHRPVSREPSAPACVHGPSGRMPRFPTAGPRGCVQNYVGVSARSAQDRRRKAIHVSSARWWTATPTNLAWGNCGTRQGTKPSSKAFTASSLSAQHGEAAQAAPAGGTSARPCPTRLLRSGAATAGRGRSSADSASAACPPARRRGSSRGATSVTCWGGRRVTRRSGWEICYRTSGGDPSAAVSKNRRRSPVRPRRLVPG
jgi:hypothetical protein